MACTLTIVLYALFGVSAILLILPFFFFYPIFLYGTFKRSAISIIVDNDKVFIRQGFDSEKEYTIEDITTFIVSRKSFSNMKALSILEWFFFKPKNPTQMTMVTADGRESLLFSYLYGSPLKKSWVKFKKQLEGLTNKRVNLEIQNMRHD